MKHLHTFEGFLNEANNKAVTKQDWDKADDEQRKNWLLSAIKDPDDIEDLVNAEWEDLPDVAISNMMKESINEATDYAVMLTGGSIGDKPRPRDARGYVGMEVEGAEELMNLQNAKAKAKRMNGNLSPGEKSHYGLKYVIVPAKNGKFIKESFINEFGPLAGSGNADQLEQIKREAMKKSERGSTVYVVGKNGGYKLSKYYEEKNTYAAYHNGMPTPVDESLVNEEKILK